MRNSNQYPETDIMQDQMITRYLKGQMNASEEKDFTSEIEKNPELKSKAVAIARMIKAMQKIGMQKDYEVLQAFRELGVPDQNSIANIRNILNRSITKDSSNKLRTEKVLKTKNVFIAFSAAACLLFCFWGGFRLYDNKQMSTLGTEYLSYFPKAEYIRGNNATTTMQIMALHNAIEHEINIEQSIVELERIWNLSKQATYNEYTEHSLLIGWILTNGYVKSNNKEMAIKTLDVIIQDSEPESYINSKAKELKKLIKDRMLI